MSFYLACPVDGCKWRTYDYDESYRHIWGRLRGVDDFNRHYLRDHHPIPYPKLVDV